MRRSRVRCWSSRRRLPSSSHSCRLRWLQSAGNIQSVLEAQSAEQKGTMENLEAVLEEMQEQQTEFYRIMTQMQEEVSTAQSDMDAYLHNESCGLMGLRDSLDQQERLFAQQQERLEDVQTLLEKMQEQLENQGDRQEVKPNETEKEDGETNDGAIEQEEA